MKNKESIEMAYNRKYERAIQDGLKTRLVKTACDCCKKPVDNSKDRYGYTNYYFKCGNKLLCEKFCLYCINANQTVTKDL